MSNGGVGRIAALEQRVEWMRGLNLFSNAFLSVALRDTAACQHVLRTLLGIPDLCIRAVRTQYRVSRLVSKDSELDVLAEDEAGRLYNLEDRSQGALSDRVHFLKAEEGGQKEMEDVVERIFQEGVEEGMERGIEKGIEQGMEKGQSTKEKRVVFRMLARRDKMEDIIDISEVSPEQIEQWKKEWEAEEEQ